MELLKVNAAGFWWQLGEVDEQGLAVPMPPGYQMSG